MVRESNSTRAGSCETSVDLWQPCCPLECLQQKTCSYDSKPLLSSFDEWRKVKHLVGSLSVISSSSTYLMGKVMVLSDFCIISAQMSGQRKK